MNILSKFQLSRSNGFGFMEEKGESLNELFNDEAVYRTAPATPGLLIKEDNKAAIQLVAVRELRPL